MRFLRFTPGGRPAGEPAPLGPGRAPPADRDGDGRSDGRHEVVAGLNRPHGLDLHDGLALRGRDRRRRPDPLRPRDRDDVGRASSGSSTGLPGRREPLDAHVCASAPTAGCTSRSARPATCAWRRTRAGPTIVRYRPDGSGEEVFATGLRNSVGFDWRPEDGQIYATDNGRDLLGDDFPPVRAEPHRARAASTAGRSRNGDRVPDPDFGKGQEARIAASIPPVHGFRAHNAPLGIDVPAGRGRPRAVPWRGDRGPPRVVEPDAEGRLQGRLAALGPRRRHRGAGLPDGLPRGDRRRRHRTARGRRRKGRTAPSTSQTTTPGRSIGWSGQARPRPRACTAGTRPARRRPGRGAAARRLARGGRARTGPLGPRTAAPPATTRRRRRRAW